MPVGEEIAGFEEEPEDEDAADSAGDEEEGGEEEFEVDFLERPVYPFHARLHVFGNIIYIRMVFSEGGFLFCNIE